MTDGTRAAEDLWMRITVLGAGSWGTTVASVLARRDHEPLIWARSLAAAAASVEDVDDPWDELLDNEAAYAALAHLPIPQRAALTLRYLDGLAVADVAKHLGRTVHGTETLLVRSRAALRRQYEEGHRHAR